MLQFLWVARRQIQATFFNHTPTASPVQLYTAASGQVIGTVGATDFEHDPLTYRVVSGRADGLVVVDDTGRYTYTPPMPRSPLPAAAIPSPSRSATSDGTCTYTTARERFWSPSR